MNIEQIEIEIESIKLELENIRQVQTVLQIGYAESKLNLAICRGLSLILSALNFLQIGIR
jgi:hypothetical protein